MTTLVRSTWWATLIPGGEPPFDTAQLKVYYPATATGDDTERLTGVFQADRQGGRLPVVLILSGINVGQDGYRALAVALAGQGFVAVTYDWVGALFAGMVGITPGVDLAAARPDTYGSRPTCPALLPVLAALSELDGDVGGPLHGALDLDRVGLFGHSAGGTVALQSARFAPGVRAVAAYGAHTMVATMLGWPAGTVTKAQVDSPVLLIGGTEDGVVHGSADRYGATGRHDPVTRTFDEALDDRDGAHALVWLRGANHFSVVEPVDPTSARAFLDRPSTVDPAVARGVVVDLLAAFYRTHLCDDTTALDRTAPEIASIRRR